MNYDSAGLMAQIQALIAPPTSSRTRTNNNTNNKHPYFKRPGRGHNHDTCDACHESGDLLCCDTCSASFHLVCVNPPLDYEQIPAGDWRCHRCLSTQDESGSELEANKKSSGVNRRAGKKRSAQASGREPPLKKPTLSTKQNKRIDMKDGKVVQNFFSQAVELARKMNPEQFVLPKYLMEYGATQFPGAPRQTGKKGSAKANKQVIETENGLVPSPISICFVCDISCRRGPMIKCDACSAFFHFECLNPPLTGVPQGRWLCHLHPEPTLEHKTLKSLSLTERVRLYDYAKKPIDPIQVALKFVTKTQRAKHSYFRSKVKIRGKDFTEIPGPIARCYSEEDDDSCLPQWPSLNELSYYSCNNNNNYSNCPAPENSVITALDLLAQVASKEFDSHEKKPLAAPSAVPSDTCTHNGFSVSPSPEPTDVEVTEIPSVKRKRDATAETLVVKSDQSASKISCDTILEGLDMETIYSLAAQKLRELRCNETLDSNNSNPGSINDVETKKLDSDRGICIKQEVPEQSTPEVNVDRESDSISNRAENNETETADNSKVEIPVPYLKLLIINTKRELTFKEGQIMIGRGQVELDLTEHVSCHSVTDEHCCIYYDYVGSRWELINYSPNGTIVNKVPYGCAPPRKSIRSFPWADGTSTVKSNGFDSANRTGPDDNANARSCLCRVSTKPSCNESLEGSAYLDIGSRIQIGCVRLFIVETGNERKWVPRRWLVYSGVTKLSAAKDAKELACKNRKINSRGESGSESGSNEGSGVDDDGHISSDPEEYDGPRFTTVDVRKSGIRNSVASRGSNRGRGRGRGRGSASAKRRASTQGPKPIKIVPKKLSTRGRKRKDSTAPAVVSNGAADGGISDETKESPAVNRESDIAGDHDYDGPNSNSAPTNNRDKAGGSTNESEKIEV